MKTEEKEDMRLQSFLSRAGLASRRACVEYIESGNVTVNGEVVTEPSFRVTEEDTVYYQKRHIMMTTRFVYIALHKPPKFVCSNQDDAKRSLAIDLIKPAFPDLKLHSVGRLDYMSSGLILFTNDGDFTKEVSHPSSNIEKEYEVITRNAIPEDFLEDFKRGIYVDGERLKAKDYVLMGSRKVHLVLTEGKNKELRRAFLTRNLVVKRVHRIRIGFLKLKGIQMGHFKVLNKREVDMMLKSAGRNFNDWTDKKKKQTFKREDFRNNRSPLEGRSRRPEKTRDELLAARRHRERKKSRIKKQNRR